jgi:apolipoprotein N-acyltransferase
MRRNLTVASLALSAGAWVLAALLLTSWLTDTHDACGQTPFWSTPFVYAVPPLGIAALVTAVINRRRDLAAPAALAVVEGVWFIVHTFDLFPCGFSLF